MLVKLVSECHLGYRSGVSEEGRCLVGNSNIAQVCCVVGREEIIEGSYVSGVRSYRDREGFACGNGVCDNVGLLVPC